MRGGEVRSGTVKISLSLLELHAEQSESCMCVSPLKYGAKLIILIAAVIKRSQSSGF